MLRSIEHQSAQLRLKKLENRIDRKIRQVFSRGGNVRVDVSDEFLNPVVKAEIMHKYREGGWSLTINEMYDTITLSLSDCTNRNKEHDDTR